MKNTTFFLTGVSTAILGMLVMVFDYPQVQYFEQMPPESYSLLNIEEKSIHQRLLVEITIGSVIFSVGAGLVGFSRIKS